MIRSASPYDEKILKKKKNHFRLQCLYNVTFQFLFIWENIWKPIISEKQKKISLFWFPWTFTPPPNQSIKQKSILSAGKNSWLVPTLVSFQRESLTSPHFAFSFRVILPKFKFFLHNKIIYEASSENKKKIRKNSVREVHQYYLICKKWFQTLNLNFFFKQYLRNN